MKTINIIAFVTSIVLAVGCTSLPGEMKRTDLFKEVIHHYVQIDSNKEKKEAALFLFRYMPYKYSRYDSNVDKMLTDFCDSLQQANAVPDKNEMIESLKQKAVKSRSESIVKDYSVLSSEDILEHIDVTYCNWKGLSNLSGASFDDYCEYILPYRIKDEPFLGFTTSQLEASYKSFIDTISHFDSIVPAITSLINSIGCQSDLSLSEYYPVLFSPRHLHQMKLTPRCDDLVIYLCLVLRSIGIPATYDYLPQWGNHHSMGHSWLAVKWQKKWYAFDTYDGSYISSMYRNESIPKVFRLNYSFINESNLKDVTFEYRDVVDVKINVDKKQGIAPYTPAVAVFNKHTGFGIVDFGKENGRKLLFENLGRRVFYFIGGVNKNGFTPLANPVFVDSCGTITHLAPNWERLNTRIINRKYPLTQGNRMRRKIDWAKSLSDSWIEASNDNFKTRDTLMAFDAYYSYKEEFFELNDGVEYTGVRFRCADHTMLASLKFFDLKQNRLEGEFVHDLWRGFDPTKIFDNDMLTWIWLGDSTRYISIGYDFKVPQHISAVTIHARNDGNHIVTGDQYELLVFDNGWQSLGRKTAVKQDIVFDRVPTGGLFWLKNHSRGREELPFMFDSDGNQFWAGQ